MVLRLQGREGLAQCVTLGLPFSQQEHESQKVTATVEVTKSAQPAFDKDTFAGWSAAGASCSAVGAVSSGPCNGS